jgi:hypothetical protein
MRGCANGGAVHARDEALAHCSCLHPANCVRALHAWPRHGCYLTLEAVPAIQRQSRTAVGGAVARSPLDASAAPQVWRRRPYAHACSTLSSLTSIRNSSRPPGSLARRQAQRHPRRRAVLGQGLPRARQGCGLMARGLRRLEPGCLHLSPAATGQPQAVRRHRSRLVASRRMRLTPAVGWWYCGHLSLLMRMGAWHARTRSLGTEHVVGRGSMALPCRDHGPWVPDLCAFHSCTVGTLGPAGGWEHGAKLGG